MNSLRTAFVVVTLLGTLPAFAQAEGDSCVTSTDPDICGDTSTVLSCNASNVYQAFACNDITSGSSCADLPCTGSGCSSFDLVTCAASRGNPCVGISGLFVEDGGVMSSPCAPGSACTLDVAANTETCTAFAPGVANCTVSDPFARCEGDLLVVCVSIDEGRTAVVTSPGIRDCGAEGLTCLEDGESFGCAPPAGDQRCGSNGEGDGSCVNNVAHECSEGVVQRSTDCTSTGRACIVQGSVPTCVTADPQCGPSGLGVCNGNVATICELGSFDSEVNCTPLGRTCGPIDANGQIGCAVGGEGEGEGEGEPGEGEGEGEPECSVDADCDDDETCEDGECERERSGGRDRDDEEEEAGFLTCASSGAAFPAGLGVIALLLRRRRR